MAGWLNVHPPSSEWENTVPNLAFQLNSATDAAETWYLKAHTLEVIKLSFHTYKDKRAVNKYEKHKVV